MLSATLCNGNAQSQQVDRSIYMDASQPTERRVEALLQQMTLAEKVGQMDMVSIWDKDEIVKQGRFDYGAWIADGEVEELFSQMHLPLIPKAFQLLQEHLNGFFLTLKS